MGGDESVNVAKNKGVSWPEEFNTRHAERGVGVGVWGCGVFSGGGGGGRVEGGGKEEGDVVAGVELHDLSGGNRGEELIDFTVWVLDSESCIVNCLAISHFLNSKTREKRECYMMVASL